MNYKVIGGKQQIQIPKIHFSKFLDRNTERGRGDRIPKNAFFENLESENGIQNPFSKIWNSADVHTEAPKMQFDVVCFQPEISIFVGISAFFCSSVGILKKRNPRKNEIQNPSGGFFRGVFRNSSLYFPARYKNFKFIQH